MFLFNPGCRGNALYVIIQLHPDPAFLVRFPSLTMSVTVQAANVAFAVIALWLLKKITEKKPLGRPISGPKGWPITDNLLDVPTELKCHVFSRWQKNVVCLG